MSPSRLLLASLVALPAIVIAQQPTFKTGVDVVTVDVSVSRSGEHLSGLEARNFSLFDNGARQKIDKVTVEEVPLEAYFVFDVSGSVEGAKLRQMEEAAEAFLAGLTRRDKVALVTFAGKVEIRQPLTADFDAFRRALSEVKAGGQTALFDATRRTIDLREHNDSRAVVVVLTDQHDNASNTTEKQAIETAERSDVIAYGVLAEEESGGMGGGLRGGMGGGMGFRPPEMQFQIGFLRSLAEATGGRVFRTNARLRLGEVFELVLDDARTRYVLSYRPEKVTPGWHKLQVKLVDAKGDVVARRGYYVAGAR
jgi:Ca-activated chloride channel homolog